VEKTDNPLGHLKKRSADMWGECGYRWILEGGRKVFLKGVKRGVWIVKEKWKIYFL